MTPGEEDFVLRGGDCDLDAGLLESLGLLGSLWSLMRREKGLEGLVRVLGEDTGEGGLNAGTPDFLFS